MIIYTENAVRQVSVPPWGSEKPVDKWRMRERESYKGKVLMPSNTDLLMRGEERRKEENIQPRTKKSKRRSVVFLYPCSLGQKQHD